MSNFVLTSLSDGVATITLNRPERLNAMIPELLEQLLAATERVADEPEAKVVVVTGAGRAFSVGGDLAAGAGGGVITDETVSHDICRLRNYMRTAQLLRDMPKATIAAINGACAGAGLALACACDLRYAARSAVFNTAFLTAGVSGDFGGTWTLPRLVGPGRARDLYLLSEKFSAAEAERYGLLTAMLPDDDLPAHVMSVARRLIDMAPAAVRAVKANLNDSHTNSFLDQLDIEADRHLRCGRTADSREAAQAFIEKRPPVFIGD
jgi:2-(1,2-epoxy-1,2-dihydrophenyl)acetyl-CoA isomerase